MTPETSSSTSPKASCVISSRHDPGRAPRVAPGLYVCEGHRRKIEQLVAELPDLHDALGTALTTSTRDGEHRGSGSNPGLNLDPRAVEARDEINAELVRIALRVAEERNVSVPDCRGYDQAQQVSTVATWLLRHVEWLCEQPDADETHDYLAALHGHRSIAYPSGRRRFPIGVTCNRPVACDARTRLVQHCDGRLVALLMPDDDRENLSEVTCDTCGLEVPLKAASLPESWGSVA